MILIEGTLLKYMSATTVTGSISLHSFFPNLTESRVDAIMLKPSGTNFTPDQFYLYAGQFWPTIAENRDFKKLIN